MTAADARSQALASQARRVHTEVLLPRAAPPWWRSLTTAVQDRSRSFVPSTRCRWPAATPSRRGSAPRPWHARLGKSLRHALPPRCGRFAIGLAVVAPAEPDPRQRRHDRARDHCLPPGAGDDGQGRLGIQRPAQPDAQSLERVEDLQQQDPLRAQVLARLVLDAWFEAGLSSPSGRCCSAGCTMSSRAS